MGASDQAAGGPAKYPEHILEKYATLCRPPLNLPTAIPENYSTGLPNDFTLSRICQYIHLLITEAPESFHDVVNKWDKKLSEDAERKRQFREYEMATYGRTYKETHDLAAHVSPCVTFERMVREEWASVNARETARVKAGPLTPEKSWRSSFRPTSSNGFKFRGNRDDDESEDSDAEDRRRAREVSPSPLRKPPTPISNSVSPVKRGIFSMELVDSAKRCRSDLESLASPRGPPTPPLETFPSFDFSASSFSSKSSTRPNLSSPSQLTRLRTPIPPVASPEPQPEPTLPHEVDDPIAWRPRCALQDSVRTVFVAPEHSYQKLFWKKDIRFHVQWELERLMAQNATLLWDAFLADDFSNLVGDVRDAVPRIEGVLRAVQARMDQRMIGDDDIDIDLPPRPPHSSVATSKIPGPVNDGMKSSTTSLNSISTSPVTSISVSARMKSLYTEVDREETSIRADDGKGMLCEDPEWSYGGKIAYTVYVCPAHLTRSHVQPASGPRIQLFRPIPATPIATPSATLQEQQTPIWSRNPIDTIDNPVGPASHRAQSPDATHLPFTMTLAPPKMSGKSFRLARRFGSRRVLNFKLKDTNQPKERQAMFDLFVGRQFALFGRIYRAIWAPADKSAVYAVEVNDEIDGLTWPAGIKRYDPVMPSFVELLKSFNDLELKAGQAMAKWASRPQLLFSDSIPAVKVNPASIGEIDDIVIANLSRPATTEQTLTDGCGLMTEAIARKIAIRLECQSGRPCVVQIRLRGAKGLLALMTPEQELRYPGKSVLLRKSMIKSLTDSPDPSLYIIDVVRVGENVLKVPAALSAEATIALSHRGVPDWTLVAMAKLSLDQLRDQFSPGDPDKEDINVTRQRLVAGLYGQGGVGVDRKKRRCLQEAKSAKVAGLAFADKDPWDMPEAGGSEDAGEEADLVNGQPSSLAECLMMAIDAGFDPRHSAYASAKLHYFMKQQLDRVTRYFRIPVEQSLSAFIIPDPCGVLRPNEIYVACDSRRPVDPVSGRALSHILGPVLAYRSPCKLPSDFRKFTAVYKHELRHLTDCVVMSASPDCTQSPASFLAGGDYDGDTATIIWDPALVEPFIQAPDDIANVPSGFESENFEKELVQGSDFLRALSRTKANEEDTISSYQVFLLGAVSDEPLAGLYSILHDNAVYRYGHDHQSTIRLARMFSLVLDARKSGLCVKREVLAKDRYEHSGKIEWRDHKNGAEEDNGDGQIDVVRTPGLPKFIMDRLLTANKVAGREVLLSFPQNLPARDPSLQPKQTHYSSLADYEHLSSFWKAKNDQTMVHGTREMQRRFDEIEEHVKVCKQIYDLIQLDRLPKDSSIEEMYIIGRAGRAIPQGASDPLRRSPFKSDRSKQARDLDYTSRERSKQQLAKIWHERPSLEEVGAVCAELVELKRLKISLAAEVEKRKKEQTFAFAMDFPTTLQMKAEKVSPTSTTLLDSGLGKKPTWRAEKR